MKKINVQARISIATMIIVVLVLVILVAVMWYFIYGSDVTSYNTRSHFSELWFLVIFFVPLMFKEAFNKNEYVSDIVITDNYLQLIYKIRAKVTQVKTFEFKDVRAVNAQLDVEVKSTGRKKVYITKTTVKISLNNNEEGITFEQVPSSLALSNCPYNFLLDLLSISQKLPNFTYDVNTSEEAILEDIKYFVQTGKRIPLYKRKGGKLTIFLITLAFLPLVVVLLMTLSFSPIGKTKLSNIETEYMHFYDSAKIYADRKEYQYAISELNKAGTFVDNDYQLYLKKAYYFKKLKDYNQVLTEANKALALVESDQKSVYEKANKFGNYPGRKKSIKVQVYTCIGEAEFALKNYIASRDAYSKVIENSDYKYTDAYLWRGANKYYLGDMQGALADFEVHKQNVIDYMQEMSSAKYPQYTQEDLILAERWIEACKH